MFTLLKYGCDAIFVTRMSKLADCKQYDDLLALPWIHNSYRFTFLKKTTTNKQTNKQTKQEKAKHLQIR